MKWFAVLLLVCVAGEVHAYLDPGTGSMLLQVLLGGVAAVAVAVKLYWFKILNLLGIRKDTDSAGPAEPDA